MRLVKTAVVASMVVGISLFTFFATSSPLKGDLTNGKTKYDALCSTCHGTSALGDGLLAENLPHKPANLVKKLNNPFTHISKLSQHIINGKEKKGMPPFGEVLSETDVNDILAYIDSIDKASAF